MFWKWNDEKYNNEKLYINDLSRLRNDPENSEIIIILDRLNSKSSNLLQHVSIMIAILSVFFVLSEDNGVNHDIFRYALLVEIMAYSLISLGCLRVNWMAGPENKRGKEYAEYVDVFFKIAASRRKMYKLCFIATCIITSFFIITLWWHYIIVSPIIESTDIVVEADFGLPHVAIRSSTLRDLWLA